MAVCARRAVRRMAVATGKGFTLVEVLVALAVLAIALTAVSRVTALTIDTSAALRGRTLALWVAQDRLVTYQMQRLWPAIATTDGETEYAGRRFVWREQVMGTPLAGMRRIVIEVRAAAGEEVLAELTGFVQQTGPPS